MVSSSKLMTVFFSYSTFAGAADFSCATAKSGAAIVSIMRSLRIVGPSNCELTTPAEPRRSRGPSPGRVGRRRRGGAPLGGGRAGRLLLRGILRVLRVLHVLRGLLGGLPRGVRLQLLRRLRRLAVLLELRLALALQLHHLRALREHRPGARLVRLQLRERGLALGLDAGEEEAAGELDGGVRRLGLQDRGRVLGDAPPRLLLERHVEEGVARGEEPVAERERLAELRLRGGVVSLAREHEADRVGQLGIVRV